MKTDSAFNITRTKEYKLSIQVSLDGFYFSLVHAAENRLMALDEFQATISSERFLNRRITEWLENSELTGRDYAEIRLLYQTKKFTLIPGELYRYEKQHEIANLLFTPENKMMILDNHIEEMQANLIFALPEDLPGLFGEKFPGCQLMHPVTVLLPVVRQTALQHNHTLFLLIEKDIFYLVLFAGDTLYAANSFSFRHPNDVIYYVLSLLRQHEMDASEVSLYLAGDISDDDPVHSGLNVYFHHPAFLPCPVNSRQLPFNVPAHRYITLY